MEGIRHRLHANPEIAYEEDTTKRIVTEELERYGVEVVNIGCGLVGILRSQESSSHIAIRAELDGLPIREETFHAYRSTNGCMHACGHDGHMAILLGVAEYWSRHRDAWTSTVYLVFTPAEEEGGGSRHMIEHGLFARFSEIREIYALHNWPDLDVGTMACHSHTVMAGDSNFALCVRGRGGHAAMPSASQNPLLALSGVMNRLDAVHRQSNGVLTPTMVRGGDAVNVIPDAVTIQGTIRYLTDQDRVELVDALASIDPNVEIQDAYPPTINHPLAIAKTKRAIEAVGCRLVECAPSMATEDFSYLLQQRPGTYVWLGSKDASHPFGLHHSKFDFNDQVLEIGIQYFVKLILDR